MFYRYNRLNCRIPMDLDDIYQGSVILAGGSPVLLKENLSIVDQPGVMVASMNNTATIVPTDIWICGDKPKCYSPRILRDPKLMKFAGIGRRNILAANYIDWKFIPNTYFYGTTDSYFNHKNFLNKHRDFVWWKNTFYIAIQMLYRLGFRRIFLIGCQFKIEGEKHYSYDMTLDQDAVIWNKRTYNTVVDNMIKLKPTFNRKGLEIVSCTPGSPLNDHFPTCKLEDAVKEILADYPQEYELDKCVHSSFYKKEK